MGIRNNEKYKAFNWNVVTIDGNDMKQIVATLNRAKKNKSKPLMIIARTIPGKGVSFMENDYLWHGKPPTQEQAEIALAELCKTESSLQGKTCTVCRIEHEKCVCTEGQ